MFRVFAANHDGPPIATSVYEPTPIPRSAYDLTVSRRQGQSGSGTVFFKDIVEEAVRIQVNIDPNSDYYRNVEVLMPNGVGYVFNGYPIAATTRSSADGHGVESGDGWVRLNANSVEQACAAIQDALSSSSG